MLNRLGSVRLHRIRDGVKIHATRHTFGLTMLKAGATILELMQRLGHSNIATTSRYLNSLASAENRLASHVLNEMGIAEEEESLTLF